MTDLQDATPPADEFIIVVHLDTTGVTFQHADEYRGDVCMALRSAGHAHLADEVGGWSDEYIRNCGWLLPPKQLAAKIAKEDA